jgi:hypothetical protein
MDMDMDMDVDIGRGNGYATMLMMMEGRKRKLAKVQGRSQVIARPRQKESAAHRACRFEALQIAGSGFGRRDS